MAASRLWLASSSNRPLCSKPLTSLVVPHPFPTPAARMAMIPKIIPFLFINICRRHSANSGRDDCHTFANSDPEFWTATASASRISFLDFQFVSHTMHGFYPARVLRVGLEFGAQTRHMVVHRAGGGKRSVTPCHVKKALARDGRAG